MRRDRLEERTPRNVFGGRRPGRERHSPAWTQPAARFGESPVRFGNVVDSEIRYNRVKRLIGKGQDLRIALLEADPGMIGACQCDHRRGKIEPHRQRLRPTAAAATSPGPQARSSTRIPAPIRAASSRSSIPPRVACAKVAV